MGTQSLEDGELGYARHWRSPAITPAGRTWPGVLRPGGRICAPTAHQPTAGRAGHQRGRVTAGRSKPPRQNGGCDEHGRGPSRPPPSAPSTAQTLEDLVRPAGSRRLHMVRPHPRR